MNEVKLELICIWHEVFNNPHNTSVLKPDTSFLSRASDCVNCDGYDGRCIDYCSVYHKGERGDKSE